MTAEDPEDDFNMDDVKPDESEDQAKARKRKERLEQNRISARESRKRKKTMIEELQRTVITLSRENKDLNERNESLRRQLLEIGAKYPNVVPLQAIVGQGTANASSDAPAPTSAAEGTATTASSTEAAPAAAEGGSGGGGGGVLSSLNPMNWMGGGGAGGGSGTQDASTAGDSSAPPSNQANV